MSASGVCLLCGLNRASRLCQCVDRRRDHDPIHESFAEVEYFMEDIRFWGKKHSEIASQMVQDIRQTWLANVANGSQDGNILKRIDRDAERLERRISGKLYGTAMRMAENPPKQTRKDDGLSNADRLLALRHRLMPSVMHEV